MKTLIIFVILAGLAAVAGSIVVGVKSFDGTVTENPYEAGLRWDDAQKKMQELGWTFEILNKEFITGENDVLISIFDKYNMPLAPTEIELSISRPATETYNKKFEINQMKEGVFSSQLNFPMFGFWDIGIHVMSGGDALRFEKRVFVKNRGGRS